MESCRDIGCPRCDRRIEITHARADAGTRSISGVYKDVFALRTNADERTKVAAAKARRRVQRPATRREDAFTILHISDLHLSQNINPESILHPLISDLRDPKTGLGIPEVDFLVVSGDLTNSGKAEECESAYKLLAELIDRLNLSAGRCVLVPGNYDINWDEQSYTWSQRRNVNINNLEDGS
jgi:predicted MPP superfamily phosphohydrolase